MSCRGPPRRKISARVCPKKDQLAERQVTVGRLAVEACQEDVKAPSDWRQRYRVVFGRNPYSRRNPLFPL